jgi:hypothetical protein
MSKNRFVCYVAGPISKGPIMQNLAQAFTAANQLLLAGVVPVVPHLTVYWNWMFPPRLQKNPYLGDHDLWLPYDEAFLDWADCILRLPGLSVGSDHEVQYMANQDKHVCYSVEEVLQLYESWEGGA